jgi:hypothetical protein
MLFNSLYATLAYAFLFNYASYLLILVSFMHIQLCQLLPHASLFFLVLC